MSNETIIEVINSRMTDVVKRLNAQDEKLSKLIDQTSSFRLMIDDRIKECRDSCPMNSTLEEITKTDIKTRLKKPQSIVGKIPKFVWYILAGLVAGIASKYLGIDLSGYIQ